MCHLKFRYLHGLCSIRGFIPMAGFRYGDLLAIYIPNGMLCAEEMRRVLHCPIALALWWRHVSLVGMDWMLPSSCIRMLVWPTFESSSSLEVCVLCSDVGNLAVEECYKPITYDYEQQIKGIEILWERLQCFTFQRDSIVFH